MSQGAMPTLPRTSKRRRPRPPPPAPTSFFALTESLDVRDSDEGETKAREEPLKTHWPARLALLTIAYGPMGLGALLLLRRDEWFTVPSRLSYDFERRVNVWSPEHVSPVYFASLGAVLVLSFVCAGVVLCCAEGADEAGTTEKAPSAGRIERPRPLRLERGRLPR